MTSNLLFQRISPLLFAFTLVTTPLSALQVSGSPLPDRYTPVEPTAEQARTSLVVVNQLEQVHYLQQSIDEALSDKIFQSYLDFLDNQRLYFIQEDIAQFTPFKTQLEKSLKTGELQPAFDMFNTLQVRVIERLKYVLALLDQGVDKLDFTKNETIALDRKQAAWPANQAEMDHLWRKRLKNLVLSRRILGDSDADISKSLKRRYESQLSRIYQTRDEDAFQAYMNGVTGVWDPHTQYFSPTTSENFNINMSLSLEGIGAVLQSDNEFTKVVRLVVAGPAALQGQLKPADRIVGVGQGEKGELQNVVGWRLDEVVGLIRGPKKSIVRLEVIPAGAPDETVTRIVRIERDRVKLEDQAAKSHLIKLNSAGREWKIGVIDLPTFYADFQAMQRKDPNAKSTTHDVAVLIDQLKQQGIDGLVIDLRDNGGGALNEANALVGLFIDKGPTVQVRMANDVVHVLDDQDPSVAYDGPLVVLVNRMSASASEIFAGAIQDYGRGLIVGSQTFGKGTVQAVRNMQHGDLKITQSKFYRVSGGSTQHKGVIPDIQLPSIVDKREIGEDALPAALPWDQIAPVKHLQYYDFKPLLAALQKDHAQRIKDDPAYQLMLEEVDLMQQQRQRTVVTLQQDARSKAEKAILERQLAIANKHRQLKGEAPFASIKAYEDHLENLARSDADPQKDEPDFIAKESGNLIVDLLKLNPQTASIHRGSKAAEAETAAAH